MGEYNNEEDTETEISCSSQSNSEPIQCNFGFLRNCCIGRSSFSGKFVTTCKVERPRITD